MNAKRKRSRDELEEEDTNYFENKKCKDEKSIWYHYLTCDLESSIKLAKCKYCSLEVLNYNANTTKMWSHLREHHSDKIKQQENNDGATKKTVKQPKLDNFVVNKKIMNIDERIARFCAVEDTPFTKLAGQSGFSVRSPKFSKKARTATTIRNLKLNRAIN